MAAQDQNSDGFYGFKLWHYNPSIPLAVVATVIFSLLTIAHCWRLVRTRAWFCIPFVVGGLLEIIGYAGRAAAHNNLDALTPYIIQSLLILLAPILFAASVYMILGRLIRATNATAYSIIPVNWVTKIFVTGDIFCFCIQGAGGGLLSQAKSAADFNRGENIILGGLVLQIVIFLFFVAVACIFHRRLAARPTSQSMDPALPWQRLMFFLYLTSALITTRNIFRVIEYAQGNDGYLLGHEWALYVFDGLLMATVLLVCLKWYMKNIQKRKTPPDFESLESRELHGVNK